MPSVGTAGTASCEMLNKDTATFQEKTLVISLFSMPDLKALPCFVLHPSNHKASVFQGAKCYAEKRFGFN